MKEKKMNNLSEEIINKYLTGQCSEEELVEVNTWMKESEENARQLFRMEEIYHLGKFDQYANEQRILRAERRLNKKLDEEKRKQRKTVLNMQHWMKYAAMIAVILVIGGGLGYWLYQNGNDQQLMVAVANEGIVKEIILPDGTKVWLNNSATLKYPREFSEKERNVYLDGEAYFEVTKNRHKPFTVQSDAMRVRVLGTTFNFKCDRHCRIAEATLIEGEIEVKGNKEEGQIILAPGQRAELNKNNGRLTVKQVNAKLDAVWHDNLIPFQKADIFTISKALERFYDVKIILSPDMKADKTYSGVLKKKSTIESVLKSLQNSIPIDYKIVGNNIFISPK
ncbi:FecR domain-containing protein [Bacteroides sp. A1-P5]|uniref:FecR domain-containing protein n=1 Tax=Bacteroides vicugnae TaxID=3037989 RepID=A0ABU5HQ53_9BACE|nr:MULTISPECIES: FecR domain-containing protein [unclassified Bacteroides]MCS2335110.1 FecR domain-containing protein [Bacteroides sp. BFG-606]MDY7253308.1 FecR domain-containing protein [Bacteroides sp. A1-P5]MDY7257707.1 FecR domain-containing protein [Bacteroides sp. A2-P53]